MAEIKKDPNVTDPNLEATEATPDAGANIAPTAPQSPPTQTVPEQTPVGTVSQIDLAYQNLTPEQKNQIGSAEDFAGKVQERQEMGASEDSSIGSIITEAQKTIPPKTVMGTDDAQGVVDKTQKEMDDRRRRQEEFDRQDPSVFESTGEDPELQSISDQIDAEYDATFNLLEDRKATMEQRSRDQISSIQDSYDRRRAEMRNFNANRSKSLELMGTRSGRQQFAGEWQSNILAAEEKAGLDRIRQIDSEEQAAILGIESALEDNEYELMMTQINLASEKRKEKQAEIDKLQQLAIQQEELMIQKQASAREDAKFLLDVDRFQQEIEKFEQDKSIESFNQAMRVAEHSGQRVAIDENNNVVMLPQLTFDNQLKADMFSLDVEKFNLDKTINTAQLELQQSGHQLNVAKFKQDVEEFGLQNAIANENLRLAQNKAALDRFEAGIPTMYDEIGTTAPLSDIVGEIGSVITSVDANAIGKGSIRADGGWECGEYAEQIVNLGTPNNVMGNYLSEKIATIEKYGLTADEVRENGGFAVGDVIITDGSDVSKNGNAIQWGHVAVVAGVDANGNLILQEANQKGDGLITSGRTIAPGDQSIQGILGRPNPKSASTAGIKQKYYEEATINASQNIIRNIDDTITNELNEQVPFDVALEEGFTPGITKRQALEEKKLIKEEEASKEIITAVRASQDLLTLIDEIRNDKALGALVGPFSSRLPSFRTFTGETTDLNDKVERLKNLLTVDNLDLMSGVLSETDIKILQSAGTRLNVGSTERSFKEELDRLTEKSTLDIDLLVDPYDPNNKDNIIELKEYQTNWNVITK